jgi:hypothetical protein
MKVQNQTAYSQQCGMAVHQPSGQEWKHTWHPANPYLSGRCSRCPSNGLRRFSSRLQASSIWAKSHLRMLASVKSYNKAETSRTASIWSNPPLPLLGTKIRNMPPSNIPPRNPQIFPPVTREPPHRQPGRARPLPSSLPDSTSAQHPPHSSMRLPASQPARA